MNSTRCFVRRLLFPFLGLLMALSNAPLHGRDSKQDDFRWMHGANYVASYAATDVEMWLNYDRAVIDRELGYAERLGINSVRVFLQYHVYDIDAKRFLRNVATFVDLCEKHNIRPMLVPFDSCMGVAPSLESVEYWVASPGPHRTNPEFYGAGEKYIRDLMDRFGKDDRILTVDRQGTLIGQKITPRIGGRFGSKFGGVGSAISRALGQGGKGGVSAAVSSAIGGMGKCLCKTWWFVANARLNLRDGVGG